MSIVLPWLGALLIGLTLGLLGSGGSAITVPVLVYIVGHGAKQAIAESMAIVGLIAVVTAASYARGKQIDWYSVWFFGIPGMMGTWAGAWLGGMASAAMQLAVFGAVLLLAAYVMFRGTSALAEGVSDAASTDESPRLPIGKIALQGVAVGLVTGFVGVGGGFLIIPALVVLGKLSMRTAIGTSLMIIALNCAVGYVKYGNYLRLHDMSIDGTTIALFVALGVVGSFVGKRINSHIDQRVLKRVFAVFLILLGGYLMVREGSKLFRSTAAQVARSETVNFHQPIFLTASKVRG